MSDQKTGAKSNKPVPGSREAAQEECDRANVPIINASDFEAAHKAGAFTLENIQRMLKGEPLVLHRDAKRPRRKP